MGNHVFRKRALGSMTALLVLAAAGGSVLTSAAPRTPQAVALELTAKRFAFVPDRLEVVEGDQVALAVKSADGAHGFEIRTLKLKKDIPRGGAAVLLAFIAPTAGSYAIRCSEYCGRGHDEMAATLVVKPRVAENRR